MRISQKKLLLHFLFLSFVVVILNDIILKDIPEKFYYGHQIGQILSNLSIAYISSYIFYLIVVVAKEKEDKKNIYLSVCRLTNDLILAADSVYNEVINAAGVDPLKYNKKEICFDEFKYLCEKGNPNEIPHGRFLSNIDHSWEATYAQFIHQYAIANVKLYSDKILNFMLFLDSDYIRLINQIIDSKFINTGTIFSYRISNTDFSMFAENYNEKMSKTLSL